MTPSSSDFESLLGKRKVEILQHFFNKFDFKKSKEINVNDLKSALEAATSSILDEKQVNAFIRSQHLKRTLTLQDFLNAYVKLCIINSDVKRSPQGLEIMEALKQSEVDNISSAYPLWWPARESSAHLKIPSKAVVQAIGESRVQKLHHLYKRVDKDGDNRVTIDDMCTILNVLGRKTTNQGLSRFLSRLQMCPDGLVSFAEFLHALAAGVGSEVYLLHISNIYLC